MLLILLKAIRVSAALATSREGKKRKEKTTQRLGQQNRKEMNRCVSSATAPSSRQIGKHQRLGDQSRRERRPEDAVRRARRAAARTKLRGKRGWRGPGEAKPPAGGAATAPGAETPHRPPALAPSFVPKRLWRSTALPGRPPAAGPRGGKGERGGARGGAGGGIKKVNRNLWKIRALLRGYVVRTGLPLPSLPPF